MTESQARKLGYRIVRGSYVGTSDDRIDRWYIDRLDSNVIDRRGAGYRTKAEALQAIEEHEAWRERAKAEALREQ